MKKLEFDRFTIFLASLMAVAIASPIVQEMSGLRPSVTLWFFIVLPVVAGARVVAERRWSLGLLAIGGLALIARSIDFFVKGGVPIAVGEALIALFFGLVAVRILRSVLKEKRVTTGVISAALCVYLLFGFVWGMFYTFLAWVQPAAFSIGSADSTDFVYFSFVTLSTVGYGDILPVTPFARSVAYVEAVSGQFYMAVLISRLVALHVTHESSVSSEGKAETPPTDAIWAAACR